MRVDIYPFRDVKRKKVLHLKGKLLASAANSN